MLYIVGWGTAQSISTRILPLWFGARGTEFDWKYVQSSLNANIDLVSTLNDSIVIHYYRYSYLLHVPTFGY